MYSPVNTRKLGRLCAENRRNAGWSQQDVALDIGCTIRAISQFENGYTTSWRILSWYMLNDFINNDIVRGCARYA